MIKVKVYAKVNITLLINGMENGYHMLDSVVASADIADVISANESSKDSVNLSSGDTCLANKILRLIDAMRKDRSFPFVCINIENNIPLGGGLGGSSADLAGVIVALNVLFDLGYNEDELVKIADSVGSDTAFMLRGGCAKIVGRSTVTDRFVMKERECVIAIKGFCDTAKVFAIYDAQPSKCKCDNASVISALKDGVDHGVCEPNDLLPASEKINPDVRVALDILGKGASMSGSGSSVFLFDTDPHKIHRLRSLGYNVFVTRIGNFCTDVIKN